MTNFSKVVGFIARQPKLSIIKDLESGCIVKRDNKKFAIIFEDKNVYTTIEGLEDLQSFLKVFRQSNTDLEQDDILRLPFFAGCSKADLENFFKTVLVGDLDIKLSFEVKPADFNFTGLILFYDYLSYLNQKTTILKSNNNIIDYQNYFIKKAEGDPIKLARYLPSYLLEKDANKLDPVFDKVAEQLMEFEKEKI